MKGHQSSIIDLAIHEALEQVFSYDKDGVRNKKKRFFFSQCLNDWKRRVVRCDVISEERYNVYSAGICCQSAVIIAIYIAFKLAMIVAGKLVFKTFRF